MFRISVVVSVLALVTVACTGSESPSTTTSSVVSDTVPSTTTTTEQPDPLLILIDELTGVAERWRELEFLTPPNLVLVTDEELADRVRAMIEDELDADEIRRDQLLLGALGLAGDGTDLAALYTDLYSEQVAGFYDGETSEMVVPAGDGDLSELQRLTLVHELTHALTDQHFSFVDLINDLDDQQLFEEATAMSAVIEGDATLVESLYLASLPRDRQLDVLGAAMEIPTEVFDRTPRFLQELLLFPYTTGADFASAVWETGGFEAINHLYSVPPTTTEHIFHPADFMVGEPAIAVEPGAFTPEGYEVAESSIWGQGAFRAMFGQALDDATATAAAVGWGGDVYRLLWDGADEIVFDLSYVADSPVDAAEMFDTLSEFALLQIRGEVTESEDGYLEMSGDDFALVYSGEQIIRFVVATDSDIGRLFIEELNS